MTPRGPDGEAPGAVAGAMAVTEADGAALGRRFEADFATHLEKSSTQHRQQRRGAAAGGKKPSPLAIPGLAVASVAGGLAAHPSSSRQPQAPHRHTPGAGERPTLRRLRYLVKWGHWQLLEYEEASVELRSMVLDEVVRAFSPWVQRLYLLHARTEKRGSAELREVRQHLEPLCHLLQRSAAREALEQAVEAVGLAAMLGGLSARHVDRCRMMFPAVLETIALFTPPEGAQRRRLLRQAAVVRELLERPDVVQALSQRSGCRPEVEGPLGSIGARAESASEALEVPPEGVENEAGVCDGSEDEQDFYSCSDGEGGATAPGAAPARRTGVRFEERLSALPCGDGPHSWRPAEASVFEVRGANYFADKRKERAGPALFELGSLDILRIGSGGPIHRAGLHPDLFPRLQRARGDGRFLLVQNWILGPFQVVVVGAVQPDAPWRQRGTPQSRVWERFIAKPVEEQKRVFKVIISVEEGPWLVKRAVPKRPVLVGRSLKMTTHYEPGDHFEIVVDVSAGKTEQVVTGLVLRALKNLRLTIATLIESAAEDELPESLLMCAGMANVDTTVLSCPDDARG